MSKFAFVILHYNSTEDTEECVTSIKSHCSSCNFCIYIIDNASPNESGVYLQKKYDTDVCVRVILSKENQGFAKGNNLGILQAQKDGYNDFIVVLNNDTKLIQNDFCQLVENCFKKSRFAVLGPTIYTPIGKNRINPGRTYILQGRELDMWENFYSKGILLIETGHIKILDLYEKIVNFRQRLRHLFRPRYKYTENCVLHGCCLIFSSEYFKKFEGFDSRTFLYFEEEILYAHIIKSGLKTVYEPAIEIWHKEDGATDSVISQPIKKKLFVFSNILKSIRIYRDIIRMD